MQLIYKLIMETKFCNYKKIQKGAPCPTAKTKMRYPLKYSWNNCLNSLFLANNVQGWVYYISLLCLRQLLSDAFHSGLDIWVKLFKFNKINIIRYSQEQMSCGARRRQMRGTLNENAKPFLGSVYSRAQTFTCYAIAGVMILEPQCSAV